MGLRRLVVSDLDGTLLGDVEALRRFAVWHAAQRDSVVLAYATGRHPLEVRSAVANDGLPEPDLVIAALGTEIVDRRQRTWSAWSERFERAHGERVRAALRPVSWLELQPAVHQSALKASYNVRGLSAADLGFLERILADARIQARLIHSGGGSFLDVVPTGSGKGPATEFIARALGQRPGDVLTFGDSGNDVDLLAVGFSATIVANALPEVDSAVGSWAYRSPYRYAAGVLDGIRHWSQRSRSRPSVITSSP
jgi:sucrose-6F-phosphate phosphohydrolase